MGNNIATISSGSLKNHERFGPVKFLEAYDKDLNHVIENMHI
jgi:hypothetical protein